MNERARPGACGGASVAAGGKLRARAPARGTRIVLAVAALAGAALAVTAAEARAATGPPETYAIVVGWNGGLRELPDLRYADDDAVRLALFFGGMAGDPQAGRVWLLTDIDAETRGKLDRAGLSVAAQGPPTRDGIFAAFQALAAELRQRPARGPRTIYFAYAGHGLRGRLLLKPEHAAEAALTGAELRAALADVVAAAPDAQPFVFLDACRSQSLFSDRGPGTDDSGPDLGEAIGALERRAEGVRIGVLTAAHKGKPAGEVRALEAGYFSHVLASGLAGAADADGDDVVTFGELAAFVAWNTQALTGQLPWFDPPGGDLGVRAIDHRGRRPRLSVSAQEGGRYLVGAGQGLPVFAEARKDPGRALRLALPPGRYRVTRILEGGLARAADVDLKAGETVDLAAATWGEASQPRVLALARGDDDAAVDDKRFGFAAPFSREAVSTLAAGYHAGREPPSAAGASPHALVLAAGAGAAPLGLPGAEAQLALRYRLSGARLAGGLELLAGSSSHEGPRYRLRRLGAVLAAGPRWAPHPAIALHLGARAGLVTTLRSADEGVSGDLLGPLAGVEAGAALALSGRWFAAFDLRYDWQWIAVDDSRRGSGSAAGALGLGLRF